MLEMTRTTEMASPAALREHLQLGRFDSSAPWSAGCAPGRLDVMGGISDYCGGLAVGLTLASSIRLAAQRSDDGQVDLAFSRHEPGASSQTSTWALSNLYGPEGVRDPQDFASRLVRLGDRWALPLAGILHGLVALGHVSDFGGGLRLVFRSQLLASGGLGATAASQVVLVEVLSEMFGFRSPPEVVGALCRYASRTVCHLPTGNMDPPMVLLGQAEALLPVNADSYDGLPVPAAIRFWGIDSGVRHRLADQKQRQTRTAAAMGARIIDALHARSTPAAPSIGLCLAGISPLDYVATYRDRLPTRMKGADFLDQYGKLETDAEPVEPEVTYKIRSRTEHHIYENQRCRQFVHLLRRAAQAPHARWLQSAGQLMNSSHWSYGQRCGLGTIETDLLVSLLQKRGIEQGVFGARISGAGAGGMVTVMAANNPRARQVIAEVMDDYEARTGYKPTLYEPGGCGARQWGVRRLDAPDT